MIAITMPWPPAILSPNARPHWAVKARAVKAARTIGFYSARKAHEESKHSEQFNIAPGKLHLWIDFHPPSNRRIDDDNCLSRFKPFRDGLADYFGIDDTRFISHPMVKEKIDGGGVKIRITTGPT